MKVMNRNALRESSGFVLSVLLMIVGAGLVLYLFEADYRSGDLIWMNGLTLGLMIAAAVTLLLGIVLNGFGWWGPISAPVAEGYAWRPSIRSRLSALGSLLGLWIAPSIYYAGLLASRHQDTPRIIVAALLLAGCAAIVWLALASAFSGKPVVAIDREGLRALGLRGRLPWDRIDSIQVSGDLTAREITLNTLTPAGTAGPRQVLSLDAAGLQVRPFLDLVQEVAPEVAVKSTTSRVAAVSGA